MENDRNQLLENLSQISRKFQPKNISVYSFAETFSAEVFHPKFLKIMHYLEECEDAMLMTHLEEVAPCVYCFPIFKEEFCTEFISELQHCAEQSKLLELPIRKANVPQQRSLFNILSSSIGEVRNSRGVTIIATMKIYYYRYF